MCYIINSFAPKILPNLQPPTRKAGKQSIVMGQEPVLSRLDRMDNMLRQLEDIRGCNSSSASTPSSRSGTLTSDGLPSISSVDFSPKSLEKHCRPIDHVIMETEAKGTLVERLHHVEDRLLRLCLQLEEEWEAEKKREDDVEKRQQQQHKKKGIKQLVQHCVKGKKSQHKAKN